MHRGLGVTPGVAPVCARAVLMWRAMLPIEWMNTLPCKVQVNSAPGPTASLTNSLIRPRLYETSLNMHESAVLHCIRNDCLLFYHWSENSVCWPECCGAWVILCVRWILVVLFRLKFCSYPFAWVVFCLVASLSVPCPLGEGVGADAHGEVAYT